MAHYYAIFKIHIKRGTIPSEINCTLKGVYLLISKLHFEANLFAINKICASKFATANIERSFEMGKTPLGVLLFLPFIYTIYFSGDGTLNGWTFQFISLLGGNICCKSHL